MKSFNILKCSRLLQTNKLVIPLQERGSKNGPVLSLQQNINFELHIIYISVS